MDMLFATNAAVAGFVFYSSMKASLLIAMVLVARYLFARQLSAHAHYLLWLAVVVSLATPIGFTTEIPQLPLLSSLATSSAQATVNDPSGQVPLRPSVTESLRNRSMPSQGSVDAASLDSPYESAGISLQDALSLAWLGVVLQLISVVFVKHRRFKKIVRAAVPADVALQALLDDCRQQTRCTQPVRLLVSFDIDAPLVCGSFRPCLLLPVDTATLLGENQLRHVFLHELMHVKNYDIATNWLLTLLQVMHWFNPLVWFALKQLRFDRELARDAATMQHLESNEGQQYGQTLLLLSRPPRRPQITGALGIVDAHAQLRRRIVMIVQGSLPTRLQSILTATLLLLLGTMAFSKPVLNSGDAAPVATAALITTVARTVTTPLPEAPATGTTIPTAKVVSDTLTRAGEPAPGSVTTKPAVPTTRTTASSRLNSATAANDPSGLSARPMLLIALADADARPNPETTMAKPETYPDWNAIQTLAQEAAQARDPGVKFIADLNAKAEACSSPITRVINRNYTFNGCGELYRALLKKEEISAFWNKCVDFMKTYNRLASNFARADELQFIDRNMVKSFMIKSHESIGEFCNPQTYAQEYPKLAAIIAYSQRQAEIEWRFPSIEPAFNPAQAFRNEQAANTFRLNQ